MIVRRKLLILHKFRDPIRFLADTGPQVEVSLNLQDFLTDPGDIIPGLVGA